MSIKIQNHLKPIFAEQFVVKFQEIAEMVETISADCISAEEAERSFYFSEKEKRGLKKRMIQCLTDCLKEELRQLICSEVLGGYSDCEVKEMFQQQNGVQFLQLETVWELKREEIGEKLRSKADRWKRIAQEIIQKK